MGISGGTPLGTKDKPSDRTSNCGGLSILDDRLVMYLFLFIMFLLSFLASLHSKNCWIKMTQNLGSKFCNSNNP